MLHSAARGRRMRFDLRYGALGEVPGKRGWPEVLRADPCSYCGGPADEVDHIVPVRSRRRGAGFHASDRPENWTASCRRCNALKTDAPLLSALLAMALLRDLRAERAPLPEQIRMLSLAGWLRERR